MSIGVTDEAAAAPGRVLFSASRKQFWQGRYSPDGWWVSFVGVDRDDFSRVELGIAPANSRDATTWTRVAADHVWADKPRWSPDGRTLYFLSLTARGAFELWGVRNDPARGAPAGAPFHVAAFESRAGTSTRAATARWASARADSPCRCAP